LAISGGEGLSLFETGTWKLIERRLRDGEDGWPGQVAFSPDGSMLVAPYTRDCYQLLDKKKLGRLAVLEPPEPSSVGPVAFSFDGHQLAIASRGLIHVWNLYDLRRELERIELDWPTPPLSEPMSLPRARLNISVPPEN
jgi:hypothetical protein